MSFKTSQLPSLSSLHYELQDFTIPKKPSSSVGKEFLEQNVVECAFWGNRVVCITKGNQIFCISDFKNPKPRKLSELGIEDLPHCMVVIEPQYTMSENVKVLLGVGEACVIAVEEDGVQRLGEGVLDGPQQSMAVTHDRRLWV